MTKPIPAERKMKILQFIPDGFPTFRPDVTALFGRYLFELGVGVDLVANPTDGKLPAQWPAGQVYLSEWGAGRVRRKLYSIANDLRCMARNFGDWDIIQVRDKPLIGALCLLKAKLAGRPFVFWMSFPISESAIRVAQTNRLRLGLLRYLFLMLQGSLSTAVLYRIVIPFSSHVFVQSDRMRDDVISRGGKRARLTPVPMGFDPERFHVVPRAEPFRTEKRVIGYLGTCDRMRRIDFIFESFAKVMINWPDTQLLIVGDAQEEADKEWLRETARSLGIENNLVITGWLPPDEAQTLISQAEVCLAIMAPDPLLDSTTPTKLVEYLALGKPVVANDHPDHHVVTQATGSGICTPFDATAFAEAIESLLRDPTAARKMGEQGRKGIENLRSYPKIAEIVHNKYKEILG